MKKMPDEKRKVLQFFTHKDMTLALFSDGAVFDFKTGYEGGKEVVKWRRRKEFETAPQDE
jgi:hypothetical protein